MDNKMGNTRKYNKRYERAHPRADLYRAEREKGMTYQQIAEKHGVSRQCVGQVLGKSNPRYFRAVPDDLCVYPKLRRWMNDNKISEAELLRRMGCTPYATMCQRMSNYLRGRNDPPKYIIDKMIAATGMKYEEIFYREDE